MPCAPVRLPWSGIGCCGCICKKKLTSSTSPFGCCTWRPEICFVERFERLLHIDYVSADLDSPWAQVKMDLHDVPFADNSFDVVLCNHVMEHVQDDIQCMREILRVLKPGGWAIIQSPTYDLETTYEDS